MMDIVIVFDHLFISLIAWVGGAVLGGIIGYFLSNLILKENLFKNWITFLIPWRSFLFVLILLVWSPYLVIWLGLGNLSGTVMVGLTLLFLSLASVMNSFFQIKAKFPIFITLLASFRSFLIISLFATLFVGYVGAGGFGFYLWHQLNLINYSKLIEGIIYLGGIVLAFDLIFGLIQYMVIRKSIIK